MEDVRSLLRNERASRRINHPQASYSSTGTLFCLSCHIQLKSESLWDSHLRSAQHTTRLQKTKATKIGRPPPQELTNGSSGTSIGKKRRAIDAEEDDGRKRTKPTSGLPQDFFDNEPKDERNPVMKQQQPSFKPTSSSIANANPHQIQMPSHPHPTTINNDRHPSTPLPSIASTTNKVNEAEWAAFERDIALPSPPSPPLNSSYNHLPPAVSALSSSAATIIAAPLTAAEIAARLREEAGTQGKEKREEELEGEKEDATRRLEMEFEEMEGLEMRVKRLKDRWRDLGGGRRGSEGGEGGNEVHLGEARGSDSKGDDIDAREDGKGQSHSQDEEGDDDGDDDEEDEWDGWILR